MKQDTQSNRGGGGGGGGRETGWWREGVGVRIYEEREREKRINKVRSVRER